MLKQVLKFTSVAFVVIIICTATPRSSIAQTYHTVKKSETLYSISTSYDISVSKIKELNNLKSNNIDVGQRLLIKPKSTASNPSSSELSPQIHRVQSGESLFAISRKYDVPVNTIKALNDLNTNTINIGQELIIKLPDSKQLNTGEQEEALTYSAFKRITLENDGYQHILDTYQLEYAELRILNPELNLSKLSAGQTINVIDSRSDTKSSKRTITTNPYLQKYKKQAFTQTIELSADNNSNGESENDRILPVFVYNEADQGKVTTSGELLNNQSRTIAHPILSMGSLVKLQNLSNGFSTVAIVNDRTSEQAVIMTKRCSEDLKYKKMDQHQIQFLEIK